MEQDLDYNIIRKWELKMGFCRDNRARYKANFLSKEKKVGVGSMNVWSFYPQHPRKYSVGEGFNQLMHPGAPRTALSWLLGRAEPQVGNESKEFCSVLSWRNHESPVRTNSRVPLLSSGDRKERVSTIEL
jgi:hypothetical protein